MDKIEGNISSLNVQFEIDRIYAGYYVKDSCELYTDMLIIHMDENYELIAEDVIQCLVDTGANVGVFINSAVAKALKIDYSSSLFSDNKIDGFPGTSRARVRESSSLKIGFEIPFFHEELPSKPKSVQGNILPILVSPEPDAECIIGMHFPPKSPCKP